MNMRGRIVAGRIELDGPINLPDGVEVDVTLEPIDRKSAPASSRNTLAESLAEVIGAIDGLPSDLAEQHDHYIHGTPKK